jgi:hypothetical protein
MSKNAFITKKKSALLGEQKGHYHATVLGAEFMIIQNLRDSRVDLYSCCVMIRLVTLL